ncbi:bifunctional folylpolyglutamate synthase/dihydrofolate synthase [Chloroflexota bacterium]
MDYQSALDYILQFADYERLPRSALVFDLKRLAMLLKRLGNPQDSARSIHVAGTKGKGSTSTMIASILTHAGYKVGLYTSPHLLDITERIRVDGQNIAQDAFARLVETLKPEAKIVNQSGGLGELTTFELLTALAFLYFREMRVDYQVLETGLGGRLDATNVVKPAVCVITSISFDHMEVLGNTLALIAGEKAGIIKPGSTVICSPQFPEAMEVIEKICQDKEARLVSIGNEVTWNRTDFNSDGQLFELRGLKRKYYLNLPLLGEYQLENAATAVAAVEVLSELEAKVSEDNIADGLKEVQWPGRLQILHRQPWVVIDGAHNAYSAKRLGEALRQYFEFDRLIIIFGASSDKDIAGLVAELARFADEIIVTGSRHPRALKPVGLSREFSNHGIAARVAENVASSIEIALAEATPEDLICATGSIFVIAEVLEYMTPKE